MQSFLFYTVTLSFALGVLLESLYPKSEASIAWLFFLSLVVAVLWRRSALSQYAQVILIGSVVLLGFALGSLRVYVSEVYDPNQSLIPAVGTEVVLEGVVHREPLLGERSTQLYVATEEALVLVRTDRYAGISYGDRVRVSGRVELPEPFETDLGRTFNYPGYLKAQGVSHVIPFATVEVVEYGSGNFLVTKLLAFKSAFIERIKTVIPEPQVGLAQGLLLGVKAGLGEDLEAVFRSTGIIHIVVLSGYNIMLVIVFVIFVLSFVLPFRARLLVGLLAIVLFALMVGLSATVLRASLMASLLLIARLFGRTYQVLYGLMLAGTGMLILNPYLLAYDTGFQLSFMATLGLILVAPQLEAVFSRVPTKLGVREFLVATLATQIFVLPLLLYQIGEFSMVAVLVNVLVLPMVPVAMLATFLTGVTAFFSMTLASVFSYFAYASLTYIISIAEWFGALSFASYMVPVFPFWVVVLSYVVLGYVLFRYYNPVYGFGKSELAEKYLLSGEVSPTVAVSAWTIEEETVVKNRLQTELPVKKVESRPSSTKSAPDTPVFFR